MVSLLEEKEEILFELLRALGFCKRIKDKKKKKTQMLTQLLKLKTQLSYFNATWTNAMMKIEFPRAWTEYDILSKTI